MENNFTIEKAKFIENYNLARPIMTILGDEVRQEILLALISSLLCRVVKSKKQLTSKYFDVSC